MEAASPGALPAAAPTPTSGPHRSRRTASVEVAGFQGRANKPTDACYSFWNTAAMTVRPRVPLSRFFLVVQTAGRTCLLILAVFCPPQILIPAISPKLTLPDLVDPRLDRAWLLSCQHPVFGGIAREQKAPPGELVTRKRVIDPPSPVRAELDKRCSAIDVYHTYLSLAALSLGAAQDRALDLRRLDPAWNVPVAVAASMRTHLWQDST